MMPGKKSIISILLFICAIVIGFIFLLRGCLSKYDERSALPGMLYFEKAGQQVIFSIVKFEKATSYSSKGGMVRKSVSTNYFIQTNDAVTGKKIAEKKIRHQSDIKNYPVEIVGSSGNIAWVFINELMAFDPFTLEQKTGLAILEEKNPILRGRFPDERKYYSFDKSTKNIYFTAKDGSTWQLDTKSMLASASEYDPGESPAKKEITELDKLIKLNRDNQDSLYEQKMRRPSRMLAAGEINRNEYNRMSNGFNEERNRLNIERESLQELKRKVEKADRSNADTKQKIESLQKKSTIHFSQLKVNTDTINGHWYGLYSNKEMDKLYERFQYQAVYDETARRQLYSGNYTQNKNGDIIIAKDNATVNNGSSYFLDGGLLLDKETGKPVQLTGSSFLIVHKNQLGNEGKIQLSHVNADGKVNWVFNSQLKEWADYIYTGKQLFIMGADNKELSGSDCNLLWCLDLSTGKASRYDFTPNS